MQDEGDSQSIFDCVCTCPISDIMDYTNAFQTKMWYYDLDKFSA